MTNKEKSDAMKYYNEMVSEISNQINVKLNCLDRAIIIVKETSKQKDSKQYTAECLAVMKQISDNFVKSVKKPEIEVIKSKLVKL